MCKLLMAAGLLLLAEWTVSAADEDASKAAKEIEGTYTVLEVLEGGKPTKRVEWVDKVIIKDGTMKIVMKDDPPETSQFTLDPSKQPHHIDISFAKGKQKKVQKGIYEIKKTDQGLEIRIAYVEGVENAERPKNFDGKEVTDTVMRLRRNKEK